MKLRAGGLALLTALLAGSCGSDSLQGASGDLRLSTDHLEFPRTFVGFSSEVRLDLSNGSRLAKRFEAATEAPFGVEASGKVSGGKDYGVKVVFTPESAGRFDGLITFQLDGVTSTVTVGGLAEFAEPCLPSAPCRIATFDQETGACSERVAPDGAGCSTGDECMVDQTCSGGKCEGSPRVCDDDDLCTKNVCDRKKGCVFIDESGECEVPADPCKAAICDATSGCGITDVPDGTPCGPGDCVKASICWTGECREVDVPNGTTCFGECGMGACADKECKREEGLVLKQRWSREMPPGVSLIFPGLADPSGNLYWLECADSCELVSVEPKGHVRFRAPIPGGQVEREAQVILVEGGVVVLAGTTISSHAWFDGALLFQQDLKPYLDKLAGTWTQSPVGGCPCDWTPGSLAADGDGGIWAWLRGSNGDGWIPGTDMIAPLVRAGAIVSLGTATGEPRASRIWEDVASASDLVVDRNGNAFLTVFKESGTEPTRLSVGPGAVERWTLPSEGGAVPVASAGELLFEVPARASRGESGHVFYGLPSESADTATAFAVGPLDAWVIGAGPSGVRVSGFQPASGTPTSGLTLAHEGVPVDWTHPILTARSGALFAVTFPVEAAGPARPETVVREIVPDGTVVRSCLLPGQATYGGRSVLRSGAWTVISREGRANVATVNQFELPKVDTARSGWVNVRGSLMGDGRPE